MKFYSSYNRLIFDRFLAVSAQLPVNRWEFPFYLLFGVSASCHQLDWKVVLCVHCYNITLFSVNWLYASSSIHWAFLFNPHFQSFRCTRLFHPAKGSSVLKLYSCSIIRLQSSSFRYASNEAVLCLRLTVLPCFNSRRHSITIIYFIPVAAWNRLIASLSSTL